MRIAHSTLVDQVRYAIANNSSDLMQKQIEIASGKAFTRRSQDSVSAVQAANLEMIQNRSDQWESNIDHGVFWSQVTGVKLDNLNDIMHRMREITTAASNGTHPASYREDLAEEVNNALEDILDLANTELDGVPLFAGTATGQAPFTATRTDGEISAVTYNGNGTNRQIQISDNATDSYGMAGGGTDGAFIASDDSIDLFQALIDFRDELRTGTVPVDTTTSAVSGAADHVIDKIVTNGLKQKRFQNLSDKMINMEEVSRNRISQLKDIDLAEAATELSQLQASYQASLQMAARINQISLMNYL